MAPLTEELAKAAGAAVARPASRREAFLFGVAAGVGFAIVENILYASLGSAFGGPWPAIALSRSMGAAVHPLACGLVMVGWWEWRSDRRPATLVRGYLSGVGIHALWNGSLVVIGVVESVLSLGGSVAGALGPLALTYAAALGVVLCGVLGLVVAGIAEDRPAVRAPSLRDGRMLAGWTVMSATLLVPVTVLVLAFPAFYRG